MQVTNPLFPKLSLLTFPEEVLKLTIFSPANTTLQLTSNCAYDLFVNNKFYADGGLRCSEGEVILDTFQIPENALVHIVLHYISYNNNMWHRMLFKTPFFFDLDKTNLWKCERNVLLQFGNKISSQLMRQNIFNGDGWEDIGLEPVVLDRKWNIIDHQIQFKYPTQTFNQKSVRPFPFGNYKYPDFTDSRRFKNQQISSTEIKSWDDLIINDDEDLMFFLNRIKVPTAVSCTFDLRKNGLHKLKVKTLNAPIFVFYSEIEDIRKAWGTPNRKKVHMADCFWSYDQEMIGIEWRGCRYIHIITDKSNDFEINTIRKEYNFDWIPKKISDFKLRKIYEACQNNMIACVDGGIVDTCWRERAQWVGDAFISTKALSLASKNAPPIINNVLRQISQSYDHQMGMVQGAYPIKKAENLNFYMSTYHLLWCLTVLEHTKEEYFPLVVKSLQAWENNYVEQNGLIGSKIPGWSFVDWFKGACEQGDQNPNKGKPNCFVNTLYLYLCQNFKVKTKVTEEILHNTFLKNGMYSLYPNTSPSIQATSIVIGYFDNISELCKEKFVEYTFGQGMQEHTMYYGYFVAKALGKISKEVQKQYIIQKYYDLVSIYGTIIEKIEPESSLVHGWSIGIIEFIEGEIIEKEENIQSIFQTSKVQETHGSYLDKTKSIKGKKKIKSRVQ